jgi:hypothetical protein
MFFYRPTFMDLVRMIWWGITQPAPKQELALPPLKKLDASRCALPYTLDEMAPESHCPTCKRPY